ncbi:MAG: LTA synthase family protein [Gemmatimonadales bacterium]
MRAGARRIGFCFVYFAAWMLYFAILRAAFLVYHLAESRHAGAAIAWSTFLHGARMDMAATAYPAVVVFALTAFSLFLPQASAKLATWFTALMVSVLTVLSVLDLELFRAWGYRIDASILRYVNTPKEMIASAGASPIWALLPLLVVLLLVARAGFRRFFGAELAQWRRVWWPVAIPVFALLGGLCWFLYYPARGGFQKMPMTQSTVYFSRDAFANQAAINASWNFFDAVFWRTYDTTNAYRVLPVAEATAVVDSLMRPRPAGVSLLRMPRPNVIVILWESFSAKVVARLGGVSGVTPNIDSLIHDGVLFDHFYASGDRSPEGLTAVLGGYPAQPTTEIIQHPRKSASLPALSRELRHAGYRATFYYGGDPEFTNFKSFLLQAEFDSLVTAEEFRPEDRHSSWGADDHVVLGRLQSDLTQMPRPFFVTLFTLSSHEPFVVPMTTVIPGTDETSRFLNAHAYTDRSIGDFIRRARTSPWWDSTLIVILADHGHRLPSLDSLQPSRKWETFAIPMLWLGGALAVHDTVIHQVGGQADLPATLLAQLGLDGSRFRWSRNLLSPGAAQWTWFTFTDGFGMVTDSGAVAWDNIGKRAIAQSGNGGAREIRQGQALLQRLIDDYVKR